MRTMMQRTGLAAVLASAVASLWTGCASVRPQELTDAEQAYQRVSTGPAATVTPDELHKAKVALDQAEAAFNDDPGGQATRDLAYIAHRRVLLAEARAGTATAQRTQAEAVRTQAQLEERLRQKTQGELAATRQKLADTERERQLDAERRAAQDTARKLAEETQARTEAERRSDAAFEELAKIAKVRNEERGTVITLPGDVLFASGQWVLLPSAQRQLDEVAEALKETERKLVIEGHTDARGTDTYNQDLSLRRAEAVRAYLVSRGVEPTRCAVLGYGKARPVADNATAEGRANNRRVELIVQGRRTAKR